jgi:carboxyl-terminal processing protease
MLECASSGLISRDLVAKKGYGGNNPVTIIFHSGGVKTKPVVQMWVSGSRTFLCLALAVFACTDATRAASNAELLEKGIYLEETRGELQTAIQTYQQIVDDPSAERNLAAQAQLRVGLCQLKLGNRPQAISALDRLTQEFSDKDKLLAVVEQHTPQLLDEIVQKIERNYILEVDRGELMETAIRAIAGKLDSRGGFLRTNDMEFFGTNELSQLNEQLDQKIAGIGAVLKLDAGDVLVQTPLADSPAHHGGLRAGDRIVTIDGAGLPESNRIETAVKLLRGPVGTAVTLGIKRDDAGELTEVTLLRDTVRLPSVLGDRRKADNTWDFMLDDQRKIGYIRLTHLGRKSAEEMRAALDDLAARGTKALILDLRNNPGGALDGAVAVSDLFVDSGRIVTVKSRNVETTYDAKPDGVKFPIALLVNRKTASAAEIIAACLQDHGKAMVIGERTFGQGVVKSLFPLKSGIGAVKVPIAAYYRPSGKSMNRYPTSNDSDDWGVRPDSGFEVLATDEELKEYEKDRAARDVLNSNAVSEFRDRQLQSALEYVLTQPG